MTTFDNLVYNSVLSERKKILFGCACVRRVNLSKEHEIVVKLFEEYADGKGDLEEISSRIPPNTSWSSSAYSAYWGSPSVYIWESIRCIPHANINSYSYAYAARNILYCFDETERESEKEWQIKLFLHMIGKNDYT